MVRVIAKQRSQQLRPFRVVSSRPLLNTHSTAPFDRIRTENLLSSPKFPHLPLFALSATHTARTSLGSCQSPPFSPLGPCRSPISLATELRRHHPRRTSLLALLHSARADRTAISRLSVPHFSSLFFSCTRPRTEYPIFSVPLDRTRTFSSLVNHNLTRSVSIRTRPVSYPSTRSESQPTRPVSVSLKPDPKEHGPCNHPLGPCHNLTEPKNGSGASIQEEPRPGSGGSPCSDTAA